MTYARPQQKPPTDASEFSNEPAIRSTSSIWKKEKIQQWHTQCWLSFTIQDNYLSTVLLSWNRVAKWKVSTETCRFVRWYNISKTSLVMTWYIITWCLARCGQSTCDYLAASHAMQFQSITFITHTMSQKPRPLWFSDITSSNLL